MGNGTEVLHPHGGRRLLIPGIGLVELVTGDSGNVEKVISAESLSPEQHVRLRQWLTHEWPRRTN